jgi:hypothetical protein
VVIEETFPLNCKIEEMAEFLKASRAHASGWMGFYWGQTPEELAVIKTPSIGDSLTLGWLNLFRKQGASLTASSTGRSLTLIRTNNWLLIRGPHLAGDIRINYLEAYCRTGSTDADWVRHTLIHHTNELVSASADGKSLRLRDRLTDGLVVDHLITAGEDEVTFRLTARNPTSRRSEAHWAQPCVQLSRFMGFDEKTAGNAEDYLPHCFIFVSNQLVRLPTKPWATQGRYVPGQTWCPAHVPRTDVNPRPLSLLVPSNGLIGSYTRDERMIFATAWEPYQELFQGVIRCLHSDFRLGGLSPGEQREIRGKIYVVPPDVPGLLKRYREDFPEHSKTNTVGE